MMSGTMKLATWMWRRTSVALNVEGEDCYFRVVLRKNEDDVVERCEFCLLELL